MNKVTMNKIAFVRVLTMLDTLMMVLTDDELEALIDELTVLYEVYSDKVDMRMGDQSE
jgi:hypothetical protein